MSTPNRRPPEETTKTLFSTLQDAIPSTSRGLVSLILAVGGVLGLFLGLIVLLFLQELRSTAFTVLTVGGILLLAGILLSFNAIRQSIIARRGRYSTNTFVMIAAFLILAVLVYVVAARNSVRWDTTATQQFSLAPQTAKILANLKEPVQVTGFFVPSNAQQQAYRLPAENLLDEFRYRSKNNLSFSFVDPDLQPTLANRYGITQYPTIVFEGKQSGRIYQLNAPLFQERDFTSAILIVTGEAQKKVYFLTGHGERSIQDTDSNSRVGFGLAASGIAADNYQVDTLSFAQNPEIPTDTAAIIIAGPTLELPQQDSDLLHTYLKNGGRILMLLEPNPPQTFKDLLAKWGVQVNAGTIVDLGSSLAGQPQTPLIKREQFLANTDTSIITGPLDQVYFPGAASFQPVLPAVQMPSTIKLLPIAGTTILSCIAAEPNQSTCPGLSPNVLVPALAVRSIAPMNERPVDNAPQEARLVLVGDADFASNFHLYSLNNSDLLYNSVNWLTQDISLASVRPKPIAVRQLVVTGRQMQFIRGMSWFVLPVVMAMLAGIVWWRRR